MAFSRPGVYVQETLNPISSIAVPNSASIGAFIGPNDKGPVTATLVTSWSEYTKLFGSWNTSTGTGAANNDLPLAVYLFFANGGSRAYVARVATGAVSAFRVFNDRAGTPVATLRIQAINPGAWGNQLNVTISDSTTSGAFDLTLYDGGTTDAYVVERFTDLSMTSTSPRYALSVINNQSSYIVALDQASASVGALKTPANVANASLSSGTNGSTISSITNYSVFDTINASLILNVPGATAATTVNAAISYAAGREDVFVVVDGSSDTVANQITLAGTYTPSSFAAVYYPRILIADPTVGVGGAGNATRLVGPGGAIVGLYAATDASRGVYKAPAGLQTRVAGAVSVTALTNGELDNLNTAAAPVNAIKFVPGSGIVVMGARTLKAGYVDKYVPVRRTLIYLRKALSDLTQFAVFEPNDPALWRRLDSTISSFLTGFWSQGGLVGATPAEAFFVQVDNVNNPQLTIDNGEVNISVGVALQRPAEYVIIKIGQFDGGTTVTVA